MTSGLASDPDFIQSRTHNPSNHITSLTNLVGPTAVVNPVFDASGYMTTMPAPGSWATAYTCKWDAWNRLIEIKQGSTLIGCYAYDARMRRITKTVAGETREIYYNDQWRAIEERVSGDLKTEYVYNPSDRWNLIRRRQSVSGTLDETHYVLRDCLDPVAIVTTDGTVAERYGYDAFGPVRIMDRDFITKSDSSANWT
jgi:hypothetical protein